MKKICAMTLDSFLKKLNEIENGLFQSVQEGVDWFASLATDTQTASLVKDRTNEGPSVMPIKRNSVSGRDVEGVMVTNDAGESVTFWFDELVVLYEDEGRIVANVNANYSVFNPVDWLQSDHDCRINVDLVFNTQIPPQSIQTALRECYAVRSRKIGL